MLKKNTSSKEKLEIKSRITNRSENEDKKFSRKGLGITNIIKKWKVYADFVYI